MKRKTVKKMLKIVEFQNRKFDYQQFVNTLLDPPLKKKKKKRRKKSSKKLKHGKDKKIDRIIISAPSDEYKNKETDDYRKDTSQDRFPSFSLPNIDTKIDLVEDEKFIRSIQQEEHSAIPSKTTKKRKVKPKQR
ncbi:hypothetical protein GJ496_011117 [Pomphorhynchus laevis]|nr:hypothetical protein GJ496_011117 [Pomphorhynchus laevis]